MMQYFTSRDGLKLAYRDEGPKSAMAILCLSGLTRNSTDFDYVMPHLSEFRVIRPDYRGRGASQWASDPSTYSIPVETDDTLALLDHLNIAKAAVIGTSRGGLIAMALAATAKDRLIGVALNDIGPEIDPKGMAVIRDYVGKAPPYRTIEELARGRARFMTGFQDVPHSRWLEEAERQCTPTETGLALTYDPDLAVNVLASEHTPLPDLWPLFDAMAGLPLALIRGANTDLLSLQTVLEMQKRRPDMLFADVPGRGHVPFLDEPLALDTLSQWIALCR